AIDDVADNAGLSPAEKIFRLEAFARAVSEPGHDQPGLEKATRLRISLAETGVPVQHALDLIAAFKQDAIKRRYADWGELMAYCQLSASPVGRYLVDLHGESRACYPSSDALCNALQVLNHLQDCQDDYRRLDRVYLPQDWLAEAGIGVDALDAPRAAPALRRVLDRCLDGVDALVRAARPLSRHIRNRRFAMEAAVIFRIAERLAAELRRRDPLAERVVLSKPAFLACGLRGVLDAWSGGRPVRPAG
ncbi:MAG: squalene/phytoene synthase family protein, partial [Rhodospirillaceae bacterium]|nr:squalene/phytoene synthase family protein [Rhodospirillaceae bacterium]